MTRVAGQEPKITDTAGGGRGAVFLNDGPGPPRSIDVYLVRTRSRRTVLFVTRRALAAYAASEKDRFLRFIRRLMRSRNRLVRWVGRVSRTGHRYYQRLEDRIDPLERMIKALNYPGVLQVRHAPGVRAREELQDCLRRQIVKHTTWTVLDGIVTLVAVALAPFLVPIPGPNIFFFYPFLRFLSHMQALRGAKRAVSDDTLSFSEMEDLARVGEIGPTADPQVGESSGAEPVEGLVEFLKRMR